MFPKFKVRRFRFHLPANLRLHQQTSSGISFLMTCLLAAFLSPPQEDLPDHEIEVAILKARRPSQNSILQQRGIRRWIHDFPKNRVTRKQ
ncbi:hypothetical protein YC2023_103205 [Brassica napus]